VEKVTREVLAQYASELSNWGKWGPEDEIGTLNYVTPDAVVGAGRLIQSGKVFPMGMNLDSNGPQSGWGGRNNPIRTMLATGTDAALGRQGDGSVVYADDMVTMPLQCATHWDAVGHVFYQYRDENDQLQTVMWNGYPASFVSSAGCEKCGIEKTRGKMVGRGVLLDMARFKGTECMADGEGITCSDLEECAKAEKVEIKLGDFVLVRTGQLGKCLKSGQWGTFAAGDAPGLEFESLKWLHDTEVAAIAMDTWGVEVRPNRSEELFQPWHQICIPILGMTMGEMFQLDDLAEDCSQDGRFDFFFAAPSLPFTWGAGSPINPIAIK
jgi:kynurenine formamidase